MVAADPEDDSRRLFVGMKNNIGRTAGGLAFRVAQLPVGDNRDILAPYIVWDHEHVSGATADQILAAESEKDSRPSRIEAEEFLRDALASGHGLPQTSPPRSIMHTPCAFISSSVPSAAAAERNARSSLA